MKLTKNKLRSIKNFYNLSERELEIIKIIFEGIHSNKDIAERLKISLLTEKIILHRIYCKTGYHNKLTLAIKLLDKFNN